MVSILVCTPAINGDMNFQYVLSLIQLDRLCREKGIAVDFQFVAHESLIQRARNYLCDIFLHQSTHSHMLFIDADIEFRPEDILRMVEADVPLIGGVYPKKKLHLDRVKDGNSGGMGTLLDYVVTPLKDSTVVADIHQPQKVKYIGTGMMLIQRTVLNAIHEKDPDNVYYADGKPYYLYFHSTIHEGQYLSEDYYFCETWRTCGGDVYAAYWTQATHWGLMGYQGKL